MKTRKTLEHNKLVIEVVEQLKSRFRSDNNTKLYFDQSGTSMKLMRDSDLLKYFRF